MKFPRDEHQPMLGGRLNRIRSVDICNEIHYGGKKDQQFETYGPKTICIVSSGFPTTP